jgi:predicted DNA-binding transcriptional regulator YafY
MNGLKLTGWPEPADDEGYLEWIKTRRYPNGIECPVCQKTTKHSKVAMQHCYVCHHCGHKVSPTAGTVFYRSRTPLKTWFEIIRWLADTGGRVPAKEIQRKFGMTYKTAWRIKRKAQEFLAEKEPKSRAVTETMPDHPKVTPATEKGRQPDRNTGWDQNAESLRKGITSRLPEVDANNHGNIRNQRQKQDRTARLLRLQMMLSQYPKGLRIEEIGNKLTVSKRTIYRDLRTLESELDLPIWEEGNRRGIIEGYFLAPINFTLEEATNIFFAARLAQNFYPRYAPGVFLTFLKLNSVAPAFLKEQIGNLLEHMEKQPKNNKIVTKFETLITAWFSHRKIRILYQNNIDESNPSFHILEPYFIEPSMIGNAIYIIGYSNLLKTISAFRFDNIIGDIQVETDTFAIPDDFDAIDYFEEAWGVHFENEITTVKLRFKPAVNYFAQSLFLHPSQRTEIQSDGAVIMTLKVRDTGDFNDRVMEWRDWVEILEPESMREQMEKSARLLLDVYADDK